MEVKLLSVAVEGTNMLARTFTATVSPEGGTGARRLITGDPIRASLSIDGESFLESPRPDNMGLIPGRPCAPFRRSPPGKII